MVVMSVCYCDISGFFPIEESIAFFFFFDGAQAMTVNFFSGKRTFSSVSTGKTRKPLFSNRMPMEVVILMSE